ncbi:MAG: histidine kinase [Candidatus Marinimicrobia bacterium]|nr:histidine kinase [FCB group bacterium]MBL7024197.1 histidine kinase [Candidatus Neomarinimicrobiota bacterium]
MLEISKVGAEAGAKTYILAMINRMKLKDSRIAQHLLFWGAYFIFLFLISLLRSNEGRDVSFHLPFELMQVAVMVSVVYLNLKILIPRFFETRKFFLYGLLMIAAVLVNGGILVSLMRLFPDFSPPFILKHRPSYMFVLPMAFMQLSLVAVTSTLHFMRENLRLQQEALSVKELESRQLKAELDSLKAQVNPHFLFNSLNNIYSHSLLESPQTPDLILKLSGLLNYIIYECQDEQVRLEKEMEFLTNYIALEKVRIDESVQVELKMDVPDTSIMIAPLLFVPLIENAFKHGANISSGQPFIKVELKQNAGELKFRCTNLRDNFEDDLKREGAVGGIGLENVRKRLDLIYPDKHRFEIKDDGKQFIVDLRISFGELSP